MPYTTHEKIRVESGFQSRYLRQAFLNDIGAGVTTFYVDNDDYERVVPEFNTGNTIAGVSDVQVWLGLSGINGLSRLNVISVDNQTGAIGLDVTPALGSSLIVTYSSSAIPSLDIENARKRAESHINQRLSLCYDLPMNPVPSLVENMASRLASAFLLIRGYGTGSRDTASDGYKLYEQLMGSGQMTQPYNQSQSAVDVGEIGMICSGNYQIVDDEGNIVVRNDSATNATGETYISGGRTKGRLYDITEEAFRFKDYQQDVNRDQPGTNNFYNPRIQG